MSAPICDADFEVAGSSGSGPCRDLVRLYLNGVGRTQLLTAEQEVELAKRIEAGLFASKLLDDELSGRVEMLSDDRRRDLHLIAGEGKAAKDLLIEANLRLVVSIAKRYVSRGMPLLDLVQEGNIGLIRAVEKFDYAPGYKFSTYATWWIRQAITRAHSDKGRAVRLPGRVAARVRQVCRTQQELWSQLGREPQHDEIAATVGVSKAEVIELISIAREPVSLDQSVGEHHDTALIDFISRDTLNDDAADPAVLRALRRRVEEVLATLTIQERNVIRLRFGLDEDGRQRTLAEVGQECGLTRERIRQIEKGTLAKLRLSSAIQRLERFVS